VTKIVFFVPLEFYSFLIILKTAFTILVTSGAGYIGFTLVWNCLKKAIEKLGWLAKLTINDMCADVWRFVSCLK
jgi:UDP-glucose 4-epimerase